MISNWCCVIWFLLLLRFTLHTQFSFLLCVEHQLCLVILHKTLSTKRNVSNIGIELEGERSYIIFLTNTLFHRRIHILLLLMRMDPIMKWLHSHNSSIYNFIDTRENLHYFLFHRIGTDQPSRFTKQKSTMNLRSCDNQVIVRCSWGRKVIGHLFEQKRLFIWTGPLLGSTALEIMNN